MGFMVRFFSKQDKSSIIPDTPLDFLILIGFVINVMALFTQVMDQDSAMYAAIAKHMVVSDDWINLYSDGKEWLDKPHLPFWIAAFSFKLFGISSFTYKLPSLIIWSVGIIYLYKLGSRIYNPIVAKLSVVIYMTSLHVILANYDVRAEGYLTSFIIASSYYIYQIYKGKGNLYLLPAAFFAAMAVMTKGIFFLAVIASGFVIYWMLTRQWNEFAKPRWWLLIVLTFLFILPELYCLYLQFDLHPEKVVFGQQGVSGIRFFFWDSQFGRFMNTGPIKGSSDPFFFLHTLLWAFLPWTIFLISATVSYLRNLKKRVVSESAIIATTAVVTLLVFSASSFQLPHYIVILHPHFALISAAWLFQVRSPKLLRFLNASMWFIFIIIVMIIALVVYFFKFENPSVIIAGILLLSVALIIFYSKNSISETIRIGMVSAALVSIFIYTFLYSELMRYDAGMNAAQWINKNKPGSETIVLDCQNYPFDFYSDSEVQYRINIQAEDLRKDNIVIFAPDLSLAKIDTANYSVEVLKKFEYFHITTLEKEFIDNRTRSGETGFYTVAKIRNKLTPALSEHAP
jgi:4-amino-4-deoxy-L-arabinose transferase-like glycosyltransferase